MTYKHIEASREARLWVTQVIVPLLVLGSTVLMVNPDLKEEAKAKVESVKDKIKGKLHK